MSLPSAVNTTVIKTQLFIKEIMDELNTSDPDRAFAALRIALHALRDRLPTAELVQLGAQLPLLVRGLYYEGWTPRNEPKHDRTKAAFVEPIQHALHTNDPLYAELIARAVFRLLARHVSAGEIEDVRHALPVHIRELWPQPAAAAARSA
jgi:uncharacterized protein (DUF2267 family)